MTELRAVTLPIEEVCWPWHLRFLGRLNDTCQRACVACGQDIAASQRAVRPGCLYCAMESGRIRAIEPATSAEAIADWRGEPFDLDTMEIDSDA